MMMKGATTSSASSSVPGVREDDPLNGAKVALPPQNYTWDA